MENNRVLKFITLILIPLTVILIVLLSSCSKDKEVDMENGKLALEKLDAAFESGRIYVGSSEKFYIDDYVTSMIEYGAYYKPSFEYILYNEDFDDYDPYYSSFYRVGNYENQIGDYDFEAVFEENPAYNFITDTLNSIASILESPYFVSEATEKGFKLICTSSDFILSSNPDVLTTEVSDTQNIQDLLGGSISVSMYVYFDLNEMGGIDVLRVTNYIGEEHVVSAERTIQIIMDENYLDDIQDKIVKEHIETES